MLDRDGDHYDPKKAVEYLTGSAKQGYTVAKYMLGKLYLKGEDVPKQMLHALHWLESAVKDDNQYAEYLLGKTFLKGEDIERDTERAESLLRCPQSKEINMRRIRSARHILTEIFSPKALTKPCAC